MNVNGGRRIKAIFYGIGSIGGEVVKFALTRPWLDVVGAIDSDPSKVGRDLGAVLGLEQRLGIAVSGDPNELLRRVEADVVVLTTGSFLPAIYSQLETTVQAGVNVVTSAEELAFPTLQSAELAEKLDRLAEARGVTVLATGINPGFVMDSLIVFLATASADIEYVSATRVVDCSRRRKQLQLKIGAGLSPAEFKARLGKNFFGHVGLMESAALIADGIGIIPDRITQAVEPIISREPIRSAEVEVRQGDVAGMRQIARCSRNGDDYVNLEVLFSLGAREPRDRILIKGMTELDVTIREGIAGDQATVAILINSIARALDAPAGLLTPTGKRIAEITWRCAVDRGY
jgi:4-hydroxy-tetrahydrodipicolinate reductase